MKIAPKQYYMTPNEMLASGWRPIDVEDVAVLLSPYSLEAVALAKGVFRPFPAFKAGMEGMPVTVDEFFKLSDA